ncbi:hypothetical protein [Asticcacaulis solisilvae]|uniref:hypothetical protein n=1 Tax=Asticcacaulis solisilvae TaxID=1217274 RepID=UPI003FD860A4
MAQPPEERQAAVRARAKLQYQLDMATDPEGRRAYMRAWRQRNLTHARDYSRRLYAAKNSPKNEGETNV